MVRAEVAIAWRDGHRAGSSRCRGNGGYGRNDPRLVRSAPVPVRHCGEYSRPFAASASGVASSHEGPPDTSQNSRHASLGIRPRPLVGNASRHSHWDHRTAETAVRPHPSSATVDDLSSGVWVSGARSGGRAPTVVRSSSSEVRDDFGNNRTPPHRRQPTEAWSRRNEDDRHGEPLSVEIDALGLAECGWVVGRRPSQGPPAGWVKDRVSLRWSWVSAVGWRRRCIFRSGR
jgi:hypothetical protein